MKRTHFNKSIKEKPPFTGWKKNRVVWHSQKLSANDVHVNSRKTDVWRASFGLICMHDRIYFDGNPLLWPQNNQSIHISKWCISCTQTSYINACNSIEYWLMIRWLMIRRKKVRFWRSCMAFYQQQKSSALPYLPCSHFAQVFFHILSSFCDYAFLFDN